MCGIFGILIGNNLNISRTLLKSIVDDLFKLSESRGKEAAGIAICSNNDITVYKQPTSASVMIRSKEYKQILNNAINGALFNENSGIHQPIAIIGHSRLVTSGTQEISENNQPIMKDGLVGIHNGIIVNDGELWEKFPALERKYEVDTEVILSLIRHFYNDQKSLVNAVQESFKLIKGTASIALLFEDINNLLLATNNGSLYVCTNTNGNICIFASELYLLKTLIKKQRLQSLLGDYEISQVKSGTGYLININNSEIKKICLDKEDTYDFLIDKNDATKPINILSINKQHIKDKNKTFKSAKNQLITNKRLFQTEPPKIILKRCSKCLLPETMPFIEFDDAGVCNYCRNYKRIDVKGKDALEKVVAKYRSKTGDPDCIVTFSGGRDSSYGLHYIKNVLKMNPIAYTYDWGMVTDLARRNIARICGKLGVEHILVSADINKKRENIRKNVTTWLKNPDVGMIPLFMAGDKQYFYYANKLMKETGIQLVVLCENMLENTFFKSGYCGIKPRFGGEHTYSLAKINKIKLVTYYANQFLKNPGYLNSSILDTLWAYFSYYLMSHEYLNLYRYIKWDEREIESTLLNEYDWEVATDTKTTWRIGDGTASFYNHIYYAIAGFTENDTFRSNQIREGMISREKALKFVEEENKPRYESINWYCDTIGIDFDETLKIINSVPKLYEQ